MTRSTYRYSADELHIIARKLEQEQSPHRRELGQHLRLVADAVTAVAKVDEGRSTPEEEQGRINRALRFPAELSAS